MRRLLILLAAAASSPALAQHSGHGQHAQPAPPPPPAPPAADPHAGHTMPAPPAPPAADPHAGHAMPAPQAPPGSDPHAGHAMPAPQAPAADSHAGHVMPAPQAPAADPHAGHGTAATPAPPVAPPPAEALAGPAHAADLFWDDAAMAASREAMRKEHGALRASRFLLDRLEAKLRDGRDGYAWDAQGWWGGDIDKLWVKTEGEGAFGRDVEAAEVQALWSHAIDPWFDLQLGVRYDVRPDPERAYLVAGVQGLAPYWFEIDAAAFVSNKGEVSARIEGEYDLRITQKLILQPRAEVELSAQDVPELRLGSGLAQGEIGLRLRYEVRPEFAPYFGVEYERAFGGTAGFRRAAGERAGGWSMLVGVRAWF